MQQAVRLLDQILTIDAEDPHALPGSAVKGVKDVKRKLLEDIRRRRDQRDRESFKRGSNAG